MLSLPLRGNGFTGIQKAGVDQAGGRPSDSDHDLFWYKFGLEKRLGGAAQSIH